ncbi:MAG TPA: chemotaxis protein CheW [candidate division Zixibacteria bacterium]|nr:chemotaxis protein CheW [candidate division Zixibacteria bacterium]
MSEERKKNSPSIGERAGKYLTFRLAAEEYGLEILKVREIIGLMNVTQVPRTPEYIRGVINLRGKVIPVMDLRNKFGMGVTEDTEETCIIVVDVNLEGESVLMGTVVDAVSEVLDIKEDEIEDAPAFGTNVDTKFILGIGKIKNEVKILLDIDEVLTAHDLTALQDIGNKNTKQAVVIENEEVLEPAEA